MNRTDGERQLQDLKGKELLAEWLRQLLPTCQTHANLIEDLVKRIIASDYADHHIPEDLQWGEVDGGEEDQEFEVFLTEFNPSEMHVWIDCRECQKHNEINSLRDTIRVSLELRGGRPSARELKTAWILEKTRAVDNGQADRAELLAIQRALNEEALEEIARLSASPGELITD